MKARFRTIEATHKRSIDPRTHKEAENKIKDRVSQKYVPMLADPWQLLEAISLQPWVIACKRAIISAIAATQIDAIYKSQAETKIDNAKLKKLKDFLNNDERTYQTVNEKLARLATDYVLLGYMCIEIARNANGIPAAWYAVPAATIRETTTGDFVQISRAGKELQNFKLYQKGGNKENLPELIVIREYDPMATYMSAMDVTSLVETSNRLYNQDDYNSQMLKMSNIPPLILILKELLDDNSYKRFKEYVNGLAAGSEADPIGIVDGVGEGRLEKLSQDITDAAYIESEKILRERIMAVMQTPPSKLGLQVSNYAVAQQEDATFKFQRTKPIIDLFLHRLNIIADEIVPDEGYDYYAKLYTYEDFAQLAEAETKLVSNGIHSRNEARAKLGDDQIGEAGAQFTVSAGAAGLIKLDDAVTNTQPTAGQIVDQLLAIRKLLSDKEE